MVSDTPVADNESGKGESQQAAPRYDWSDPNVHAGNAPPMPRWPLTVSVVVFVLWVAFLVTMAWIRIRTTSV